MRLNIVLEPLGQLVIPVSYNYAVQGMIYNLLPYGYRERLHDVGYPVGSRRFKLFTFSRLLGEFNYAGHILEIQKGFELRIGSPKPEFLQELWKSITEKPETDLAGRPLRVAELEMDKGFSGSIPESLVLRTLSPMTVYSTLYTATGRKKTYFYSPYEQEFNELLENNLKKKAFVAYGRMPSGHIDVKPLRCREVTVKFKDQIIRAWSGVFKFSGDPDLIRIGYEAGFGSKNSAGFGMVGMTR